jgi:hypothetical protein
MSLSICSTTLRSRPCSTASRAMVKSCAVSSGLRAGAAVGETAPPDIAARSSAPNPGETTSIRVYASSGIMFWFCRKFWYISSAASPRGVSKKPLASSGFAFARATASSCPNRSRPTAVSRLNLQALQDRIRDPLGHGPRTADRASNRDAHNGAVQLVDRGVGRGLLAGQIGDNGPSPSLSFSTPAAVVIARWRSSEVASGLLSVVSRSFTRACAVWVVTQYCADLRKHVALGGTAPRRRRFGNVYRPDASKCGVGRNLCTKRRLGQALTPRFKGDVAALIKADRLRLRFGLSRLHRRRLRLRRWLPSLVGGLRGLLLRLLREHPGHDVW